MMVIAVGLSCYNIALFHLVNHAFYKALLFLGAGSVIHAVSDNQDFRKYGGLRAFLPLTYAVMLIASLSLVAFPFMTGFYSKDLILESAYGQYHLTSTTVYIIATIGAMFTTLYSVKVLYLTFLTNPNGPLINYKRAHEGDMFMSLPLMILAVFSIFFGFVTKDIFIGLGSGFFSDNALYIHPSHEILLDTEFGVPTLFKLLPLIFTIVLSIISIVLSEYLSTILVYFKLSRIGYNIFSFFNQRFLIELFYNKYITGVVLKLGGQTTKLLDKGSVEYIGPFGLEKGLYTISSNIAKLNTGVTTSYALYMLVGLIYYMLLSLYISNVIMILVLFTLLLLSSWGSKNLYSQDNILKNLRVSVLSLDEVLGLCNSFLGSIAGVFNTEPGNCNAQSPFPSQSIAGYTTGFVAFMLFMACVYGVQGITGSPADVVATGQTALDTQMYEFYRIEDLISSARLTGVDARGGLYAMRNIYDSMGILERVLLNLDRSYFLDPQ
jgi:NADH-ubiquinone oxidoreductase chain 5